MRYVFDWRGQWVGLAGWQSGAFKCRPRDQWIGWKRELQFTRMHLIANNTRFLILGAPGCFPNLASLALAAMVQRLSADWSAAYGHSLLLAETFVDPSKFCGYMYKAAGWTQLGRTKGYARANGRYTDPHGVLKDLHVFPLHRDTRSRMCAPDPLPDPLLPNPMGDASGQPLHGLNSVYEEFLRVPDFRRAQGRKHTIETVFAIVITARLAGFETVNRHSTVTHYQRPNMTHPQEGGTGGKVSEILFFSAKSKRHPSLIYSMQIIPVCLSIVARRKGVSATRRGGLYWTPISLLVGHPCKLFHIRNRYWGRAVCSGTEPDRT